MKNRNNKFSLLTNILYIAIGGTGVPLIITIWEKAPNKLTAITQTLIVVIGAAILSMILQIGQGISNDFVERINENLRFKLFSLLDRHELKFLRFTEGDFRYLELRGIGKTELDRFLYIRDAFIPLSFHRKLEKDEEYVKNQNEIGDSLSTSGISEQVSFNELLTPIIRRQRNILILGAPGSGKSTLIQYIAYISAINRLKLFPDRNKPSKIPFIIKLREFGNKIVNEKISLPNAIKLTYDRKQLELPVQWYIDRLNAGTCIVLLDGLDEVPDEPSRIIVSRWARDNIQVYNHCIFLLTSRPHGIVGETRIPDLDELLISDLSDKQIEDFITQWHIANRMRKIPIDNIEDMDDANLNHAKRTARELIAKVVGNPLYGKIITNPLLLTMIIIVDYLDRTLPGQRVELYREMINVSLSRRYREIDTDPDVKTKVIYPIRDIQKVEVLEELGFKLMDMNRVDIRSDILLDFIEKALKEKNTQISKENFLKVIEQEHGLLTEKKTGYFEFSHKSFQEYFAASYIKRVIGEEYLYDKINDGGWNETIRLFVALADGTFVLRKVRKEEEPTSDILSLAIDTLDEAKNLADDEKQKFEQWLDEMARTASEEKRGLIAKAKLYSRIRGMQNLESNISVDKGLISNLEYQYFLDDLRKQDIYLYPDHRQTYTYPNGKNAEPVTGIRGADADKFCEWLTQLDKNAIIFDLPENQNLSITHKMEQTFWTKDKNTNSYHLSDPKKQFKTFSPEEIKSRIEHDATLAKGVIDADARRNTPPVKTQILLSRAPILPQGSGDPKKTGVFMSTFDDLSRQQFRERLFLEKCETFSNTFDVVLVEHIKHLINLTKTKDKILAINEKWLEPDKNIYPFEFTSIDQHANDFLGACRDYIESRGVTHDQTQIINMLMNSLKLIVTRDWDKKGNLKYSELMELAKKDQERGGNEYKKYDLNMVELKAEKSDLLRWLIRVALAYLGANIRSLLIYPDAMGIRKNFLRAISDFYLAMMFLDAQTDGRLGFANVGIKIQMKDLRKI